MKLTQIAGGHCGSDDCPTIFTTDNDTIAVQGYIVQETPAGEARRASWTSQITIPGSCVFVIFAKPVDGLGGCMSPAGH